MVEYEEEENPLADIDEYIENTNVIIPPRVGAATFKVEHGLILMLKAGGLGIPLMMIRHNISGTSWVPEQESEAPQHLLDLIGDCKGTLPSDTIANPKGSGSGPTSHCMAITTRSGKVLLGESEQVVEVEEFEQEVEAQVEEPIVVEAKKVPEELKVQEVSREEVKEKIPSFAKYLKDLITKKKTTKNEVVNVTHRDSSIIATTTVQKKEDPGAFTPCTIGARDFARALYDNAASINLMPLAIYKKAGLGMTRPPSMRLQMAERSIKTPAEIVDDVLVKVGEFHLPADFVIFDCAVDKEIPILLRIPFLATGRALMNSERNEIKFRVNDEKDTFQASKGMKLPHKYESISVIDVIDEVEQLLNVLREHKQAIGWTIADIRGIPAEICKHKIQLENESKPSVEHQ
uniref:Uncharacterized protein LOC104219317 n=1 Tax=Nicotiana sylvestris TaxID=4096 RepID=A0A1U7VJP1_NICSY|nr:PREDICTED: uncharacterized protein LOC104219317 [Nicotiana sylvestris]